MSEDSKAEDGESEISAAKALFMLVGAVLIGMFIGYTIVLMHDARDEVTDVTVRSVVVGEPGLADKYPVSVTYDKANNSSLFDWGRKISDLECRGKDAAGNIALVLTDGIYRTGTETVKAKVDGRRYPALDPAAVECRGTMRAEEGTLGGIWRTFHTILFGGYAEIDTVEGFAVDGVGQGAYGSYATAAVTVTDGDITSVTCELLVDGRPEVSATAGDLGRNIAPYWIGVRMDAERDIDPGSTVDVKCTARKYR